MKYRGECMLLCMLIFLFLLPSLQALTVSGDSVDYIFTEDLLHTYNFSVNVSGANGAVSYSVDTQTNVSYDNGSGFVSYVGINSFDWLVFNSNGIFQLNASRNNESGRFELPIQFTDLDGSVVKRFNFTINVTNDAPIIDSDDVNYTFLSTTPNASYVINVSDEELHYPMNFSVSFFSTCTHASWLGFSDGENCSLLDFVTLTNTSAYLNYTYSSLDIGVYYAQFNLTEVTHTCPHDYCDSSSYSGVQSVLRNVTITVLGDLSLNVTSCVNASFDEGVLTNCSLSIRTRNASSNLQVNSTASFSSYSGSPSNVTWFLPLRNVTSSAFLSSFNVSINGTQEMIGNWTINVSVLDLNTDEFTWQEFNVSINWTGNSAPSVTAFTPVYNYSVDSNVNVTNYVLDTDFGIEDKLFYNESIVFNVTVVNVSTGAIVNDFVRVFNSSVQQENRSYYILNFYPNSTYWGVYNVTVQAIDASGVSDSTWFNVSVLTNSAPEWNASSYDFSFTVNTSEATTVTNITDLNLSLYVTNNDSPDSVSYIVYGDYPLGLNVTSYGIINFDPWKYDVGNYSFVISAVDSYDEVANATFNFTVLNINTDPTHLAGEFLINGVNTYDATVFQGSAFTSSFVIYDEDLNITSSEVNQGAYDESLTLNVSIENTTNVYTELDFTYSASLVSGNFIQYSTSVTPISNNTGNFTVIIVITDASNATDTITFNLTVDAVNSAPELPSLSNQSISVSNQSFVYSVAANDEEDDRDGKILNYTIDSLTTGAPDLDIGFTTGLISFNFSDNSSYAGVYQYNVSVNDSNGTYTYAQFFILVHDTPTLLAPTADYMFSTVEETDYALLFNVSYPVEGANLSYYIGYDNVTYTSDSGFVYSSLENKSVSYYTYNSSANLTVYFNATVFDETFGLEKNLTLYIGSSDFPLLNTTSYYLLNVTHANDNIINIANISSTSGTTGTAITFNMSSYFFDWDVSEGYYNDTTTYTFSQSDSTGISLSTTSSISDNIISFLPPSGATGTFNVSILATEKNGSDSMISIARSSWFTLTFNAASSSVSSGGGGGGGTRTVVERYGLKIITPGDVEVSADNYIDVNFSLLNNGDSVLQNIDLAGLVYLDGLENAGVNLEFPERTINTLSIGEQRDYVLRIRTDTSAAGTYRILINASVGSPSFSDWGEFFVKVQNSNFGLANQRILFTEKLVSENPLCLELQELVDEARSSLDSGDVTRSLELTNIVVSACEKSISTNEQIGLFDASLGASAWYAFVVSGAMLVFGFVYFCYHRIKFKNSIDEDYI